MTTNDKLTSLDLVVPIYIDTNALLDLLASIEDGFSAVSKITTRNSGSEAVDRSMQGEFGVANVLNLLKVGFNASKTQKHVDEKQHEHETERYHTYGSLLYRLRHFLNDLQMVKQVDGNAKSWDSIQSSDFIELKGIFRPNPFVASLDSVDRLMDIYKAALAFDQNQVTKNSASGSKKLQNPNIQAIDNIRKFMDSLRSDLEHNETRIFVVESLSNSTYKASTTLFLEYLRDKSGTELTNKQFTLFGKVVQNVNQPNSSINLLSGTGLGSLSNEIMIQLLAVFEGLKTQGMNLPEIIIKIPAPVLQIVPIAIYV